MTTPTPAPAPMTATIPDDWEPTAANVNELPTPLRKYIHALETDCDHAGTIRSEVLLREHTVPALTARVAELEGELTTVMGDYSHTIARKDCDLAAAEARVAELERDALSALKENKRLWDALGEIAQNADEATDLSLFRVQCRDFARAALQPQGEK